MKDAARVLIGGKWRESSGDRVFESRDPQSGETVGVFPYSPLSEVNDALDYGRQAYDELQDGGPELWADFLDRYAEGIEAAADALVEVANVETALAIEPRLRSVELPRTTDQLRQAALSARSRDWVLPTISTESGISSMFAPIPGPVAVFGPNNFPFAFNSVAGGDFAAALATGHPVLGKANPGHPETTRLLAEVARQAADDVGAPASTVQLLYRTSHEVGERLVADKRLAASAYTGSRTGGLALKSAADGAGVLIYLEMSSINPVVILRSAITESVHSIAEQLGESMMLGNGQFCTSPGLLFVPMGPLGDEFVDSFVTHVTSKPTTSLLGSGVASGIEATVKEWRSAGATILGVAEPAAGNCESPAMVLSVTADDFLRSPEVLQAEAFGNAALIVRWPDRDALLACGAQLEGNLTGTIYAADDDIEFYAEVERVLRPRVGRLLNNKPPTGVAVVPAMNHGGPYPSTGHPGFTAVGIPASLRRFAMLQCYDNVNDDRLPRELRANNPLQLERLVDGQWTQRAL